MFDEVLPALSLLFSGSILYLLLGVVIGLLVGALPGIGPTQAMALLLPISVTMEPANAIILLLATASASSQGGAVTAILLNTPGDSGNAASTFDGYQMTKKGEGAKALGAAATAGIVGSLIGIVILITILPAGRWIVLQFSYADYFGLAVFGLAIVATLTTTSMWRGLASGAAGLLASTVGMSTMTGEGRFVFGTEFLLDGLNLIAVLIGIFAVAEGFRLMSGGKALGVTDRERLPSPAAQTLAGVRSVFRHWRVTVSSSVVGTLVGIVPGVGGVMSNFLAYGLAARRAKNSGTDVGFGNGDVRGVIAPEASNNGKEGGALLPTLIFGIPGSVSMALLLAALTVHGISAGPRMMIDAPTEVLLLIMVGVGANALSSFTSFSLIPIVGQLGKITPQLLGALLVGIGLSSAYLSEQGRFGDSWITLVFGIVGLLMSLGGYTPVTFVIGFILGPLMERSMFQTIQVSGGETFFTRPISAGFLVASALLLLVPAVRELRKRNAKRREARAADQGSTDGAAEPAPVGHPLIDLFFVAVFGYFLLGALDADDPFTRLLPQGYAIAGIMFLLLANGGRISRLVGRGGGMRPVPVDPQVGEAARAVVSATAGAVAESRSVRTSPSSAADSAAAHVHTAVDEPVVEPVPATSPALRSTAIGIAGGLLFAILVTATVLSWVAAFVTVLVMALAMRRHWRSALIAAICLAAAVFLLTRYLLGVPI